MGNCYCGLTDLKTRIGLTGTSRDTDSLFCIEAASRAIDDYCGRTFYAETAARYFTPHSAQECFIDDLLSASAVVTDSEDDGTYDGESWTEGIAEDYILEPQNQYPRWKFTVNSKTGLYVLASVGNYLKITGQWGYGDGLRASPWDATGLTLTVATSNGTSGTLSAAGSIQAGQTILCETEQIYISAISSTTITMVRGVNGTTAAAHSIKAISTASYPARLSHACSVIAGQFYRDLEGSVMSREMLGDYSYGRLTGDERFRLMAQMLGCYVKAKV